MASISLASSVTGSITSIRSIISTSTTIIITVVIIIIIGIIRDLTRIVISRISMSVITAIIVIARAQDKVV